MFKKKTLWIFVLIMCVFSFINSNVENVDADPQKIMSISVWEVRGCMTHNYLDQHAPKPVLGYTVILEPHPQGVTHGSCSICKNNKGCSACVHPQDVVYKVSWYVNWDSCGNTPFEHCKWKPIPV